MNKNFSHIGVRKEQRPRYNFVALLALTSFIFIFSSSFVVASPFEDCTRYGNCKPVNPSTVFNNNTATVNSSIWWAGMNNIQGPYIIKTSTFLDFNGTKLNNEFVKYSNFSTFNSTYDNFWNSNATIWSAINNRIQLTNTTINSGIPFWYNHTSIVLTNSSSSYVPYNGALSNVDLNTRNITRFNNLYSTNATLDCFNCGSFVHLKTNILNPNVTIKANGTFVFGSILGNNSFISDRASVNGANFIFASLEQNNNSVMSTGMGNFILAQISGENNSVRTTGASARGQHIEATILGNGGVNSDVSTITNGNWIKAYVAGNKNAIRITSASSAGASIFGTTLQENASILIGAGIGSFGHGVVDGTNGIIRVTSGNGQFYHAYLSTPSSYATVGASGVVMFGTDNVSVTGLNTILFGRNLNMTGSNSFGFGIGNTVNVVSASNQFWTNAYVNATQNASVEQLFRVGLSVALPACNSASNLSVGRNITGLYDCRNGNGTWVKLG